MLADGYLNSLTRSVSLLLLQSLLSCYLTPPTPHRHQCQAPSEDCIIHMRCLLWMKWSFGGHNVFFKKAVQGSAGLSGPPKDTSSWWGTQTLSRDTACETSSLFILPWNTRWSSWKQKFLLKSWHVADFPRTILSCLGKTTSNISQILVDNVKTHDLAAQTVLLLL